MSIISDIKALLDNHYELGMDRIFIYNEAVKLLKDFVGIDHPVLAPQLIPADKVRANDYNPNNVAPPEMRLLYLSIKSDGVTQPIVGYQDNDIVEVVDGFHRQKIIKEKKDIKESLKGYVPIVLIDKKIEERKASTIRHNRARGKHGVKPMTDMVRDLVNQGWTYERIQIELGMTEDEVLRLHQINGLAELYKGREYSKAWE